MAAAFSPPQTIKVSTKIIYVMALKIKKKHKYCCHNSLLIILIAMQASRSVKGLAQNNFIPYSLRLSTHTMRIVPHGITHFHLICLINIIIFSELQEVFTWWKGAIFFHLGSRKYIHKTWRTGWAVSIVQYLVAATRDMLSNT